MHKKMARGKVDVPKGAGNLFLSNNDNGSTECESMSMAIKLNSEEYSMAKKEIEECSALLWREAKESFRIAAFRNEKVRSRNSAHKT